MYDRNPIIPYPFVQSGRDDEYAGGGRSRQQRQQLIDLPIINLLIYRLDRLIRVSTFFASSVQFRKK